MIVLYCMCIEWLYCITCALNDCFVLHVHWMIVLYCMCIEWLFCIACALNDCFVLHVHWMIVLYCMCIEWLFCIACALNDCFVLHVHWMIVLYCMCIKWLFCIACALNDCFVLHVHWMIVLYCICIKWLFCKLISKLSSLQWLHHNRLEKKSCNSQVSDVKSLELHVTIINLVSLERGSIVEYVFTCFQLGKLDLDVTWPWFWRSLIFSKMYHNFYVTVMNMSS